MLVDILSETILRVSTHMSLVGGLQNPRTQDGAKQNPLCPLDPAPAMSRPIPGPSSHHRPLPDTSPAAPCTCPDQPYKASS